MNKLQELKDLSFVTFYGSQLGQAESIAESIVDQASTYNFVTQAFPLNEVKDVLDIVSLNCPIVIIASTTGDGEPPENADKFWRKIRRKILKPGILKSVQYAILGLGDTNYNNFCHCGKEIHKRFQYLGASTFYSPGWADDAIGLELVVEDWLEGLWDALENHLRPGSAIAMDPSKNNPGGLTLPACPPVSLTLEYRDLLPISPVKLDDPLHPYPLVDGILTKTTIKSARFLSKPGSLKAALEITLQFPSRKIEFEPGDAIGIACENPDDEVSTILQRLGVLERANIPITISVKENSKGKIPNFIPSGCTLRQVFKYYSDIRTPPKKTFLRLLAEFTSDESEKQRLLELSSRQGATAFETTIRVPGLSFLDILLEFPSCSPKPEALIEHLPRLIPRAYSISSSPLESSDTFTFAFNVITFSKEDGRKYSRMGVCSGWLYKLCKDIVDNEKPCNLEEDLSLQLENMNIKDKISDFPDNEIIVYKRKNHNFRLPQNLESPIIMVGPGTGVAPFIGFLEHRAKQKKEDQSIGNLYLYFGCRNKEYDFLYEEKLKILCENKTLTKLYTSFSRDPDQGDVKYVQHNLELNKEEVVETLFEKEGFLYVCGDAKNMAKNVRDTLQRCVESVKGITESEAKALISELVTSKRYLQDVWC